MRPHGAFLFSHFDFLLVFLRRTPGPPPFSAMNSTPSLFEGMDDFPHIRSRGCRVAGRRQGRRCCEITASERQRGHALRGTFPSKYRAHVLNSLLELERTRHAASPNQILGKRISLLLYGNKSVRDVSIINLDLNYVSLFQVIDNESLGGRRLLPFVSPSDVLGAHNNVCVSYNARPESRAAETSFAIFVFVVPVMMVMPLAVILMMVERFCSDTPSYPAGLAGARRNYFPTG